MECHRDPLLFLIYINDLERDSNGIVSKFADDTKVGKIVNNEIEKQEMQENINLLCMWADKWQMKFNVDKCKVVHFGNHNERFTYSMHNQDLAPAEVEKDLGVKIQNTLKSTKQCEEAVTKANKVLGMIKRNIASRSKDVILPLYQALVRPHLEYCVQFWHPNLIKDKMLIERVQRRATKLIVGLKDMP